MSILFHIEPGEPVFELEASRKMLPTFPLESPGERENFTFIGFETLPDLDSISSS
jgi:hypothetical protein